MVNGKSITIEEQIPDQMGRAMALVYVDKILLNEKLLEAGLARYHSDQTTKTPLLKKAADTAKISRLGIFSAICFSETNLEKPNCIIKGNFENKRASGRKLYYLPNCAQYKFVMVEKIWARAGFVPKKRRVRLGISKRGRVNKDKIVSTH